FDDAGLHHARTCFQVPLDQIHTADDDPLVLDQNSANLAGLTAFPPSDYQNCIASTNLHGYSTSGASETIFMKLRSRNSRATGPKMRVPLGLFLSVKMTAAFSSKRIYEPSVRACSFAVRTITA